MSATPGKAASTLGLPYGSGAVIEALVLFPHQLFDTNAALARHKTVYLVEDALYFSQYRFHKKKLLLHRASMRAHAVYLRQSAAAVVYIDARQANTMDASIRTIADTSRILHYIDPVDDWLRKRLARSALAHGCTLVQHPTGMFINDLDGLRPHIDKPHPSMATFYAAQRKRLGILVADGRPLGGRWSLDADNRRRLPTDIVLPPAPTSGDNAYLVEARHYVEAHFPDNPGHTHGVAYPVTPADAGEWLTNFLEQRLNQFGPFEDAISAADGVLFHSVLTPMLNTGLLTPNEVLERTLAHAARHAVPLNSLEGFVRQVIGWREYVRGNYEFHGQVQRTRNFWRHDRPLPGSFWTGQTGIEPVDVIIGKVLESAYAHHIERLMILSNFMMLCEFSPDDVYRWFMEMFIDAYDWVMVPNVYGMGLQADGGLMMTKPYISGSSYILRMSNFKRGPWCAIWDGLFWRFLAKHRAFFDANPRSSMMVRNLERLGERKLRQHIETAETFLSNLAFGTQLHMAPTKLS